MYSVLFGVKMNNRIVAAVGFIIIIAILSLLYVNGTLGFDLASFMGFIALLGAVVYADRKKVKTEGIVFIRRTKRGRNFIDNTSKKNTYVWKKLAIAGVIIAIPLMIIGSVFLINNALDIIVGAKEGGVKLLLPGPVSSPVSTTGIFVVPWWIWVIGVAIVIVPHEFFHGIMCRLDGIRIKSVGWLLLVIIPGAFVEPDEAQLKKAKRSTKLKVYAAGSFANMLTAFVAVIIAVVMFYSMLVPSGVFVVPQNTTGFMITDINGTSVHNEKQFYDAMSKININDTFEIKVITNGYFIPKFGGNSSNIIVPQPVFLASTDDKMTINITLSSDPSTIGTQSAMMFLFGGASAFVYHGVSLILLWIFLFCLGVGMVNMLPIKPLDGGLIFEELCGKFTKRAKYIVKAVTIIMLLILIFNLVGPAFI